jgi:uncharacterized lipoprotein YddW (UPF0748 family)
LRSVWLTNTDSKLLTSRDRLATGFDRLVKFGFDTVYPVVWQRGYTLYPSEIAGKWFGAATIPDYHFQGRDLLAEIIELATERSIRVIPWFEYGLMLPSDSPFARQYPDLITVDRSGNPHRRIETSGNLDPQVWLNPCQPQVREFITDLIVDLVTRYSVAGIQLDDRFVFPIELGYDRFTQSLFKQQQGCIPPDRHGDRLWLEWGMGILTNFLTEIVTAVKSVRSDIVISISPNPLTFSQQHYLADWQAWHRAGLIDELVLQVYRDNLWAFEREISKSEVMKIATEIPTSIGILTGLRTKLVTDRTIAQQVKMTRNRGFAGISCFFYETIFNSQLAPTKIPRSDRQLHQIFGIMDSG